MRGLRDLADLRVASEQVRYEFLQADLELCFTFTDLAKTELELGEREAAERVLTKAEAGYAMISRFLGDVCNAEQREEIQRRLTGLAARLEHLRGDMGA
jgi:hypothetical protein